MQKIRKETRTYADRAEYMKQAVNKRRRKVKRLAIETMGNACMICGYNKHQGVLEFHHVDSATKAFGISEDGSSRSWARVFEEMRKCVLVCANCHREIGLGLHDPDTIMHMHEQFWANVLANPS